MPDNDAIKRDFDATFAVDSLRDRKLLRGAVVKARGRRIEIVDFESDTRKSDVGKILCEQQASTDVIDLGSARNRAAQLRDDNRVRIRSFARIGDVVEYWILVRAIEEP